jgi:hypothetical protein
MYGQIDPAKRAEDFKDMSKGNLIPRAGTTVEVAEDVMFVIKNDYVTGTIVDVDGGVSLVEGRTEKPALEISKAGRSHRSPVVAEAPAPVWHDVASG